MICHRCQADAAVATISRMPLCWTCTRIVKGKQTKSFVGAGPYQEAGFFCDVPGPYALGKEIGTESKAGVGEATGSVGKAVDAAKETASTIRTLAVVGAIFGGATVLYMMYRAHQMQTRAAGFIEAHPEVLQHAALLA